MYSNVTLALQSDGERKGDENDEKEKEKEPASFVARTYQGLGTMLGVGGDQKEKESKEKDKKPVKQALDVQVSLSELKRELLKATEQSFSELRADMKKLRTEVTALQVSLKEKDEEIKSLKAHNGEGPKKQEPATLNV